MPINPGLYPSSTWSLPVQFRHRNGTPIDVSGANLIARFYDVAGGDSIFVCDNDETPGAGVGTFDMLEAGITGVGDTGGVAAAILTAPQRASIFNTAARYLWTWHNRVAGGEEIYFANGYIDTAPSGGLISRFEVENSFDGSSGLPTVIAHGDRPYTDAAVADIAATIAATDSDTNYTKTAGGTANALTLITTYPYTGYLSGLRVTFKASIANSSAATLNVNDIGPKPLRRVPLTGGVYDLTRNDLVSGAYYAATYNATANSGAGAWLIFGGLGTEALNGGVSLRDFGGFGDGTSADAAVIAAQAYLGTGGVVRLPRGHILLSDAVAAAAELNFIGEGESTLVEVLAANSRAFHVTGAGFRVIGAKLLGNGSSNASSNGVGVYVDNAERFVAEHVFFDGMGFGAVTAVATGDLKKGPVLIHTKTRNTQSGGTEYYTGGRFRGTEFHSPDGVTNYADRLILMFDNDSNGWNNFSCFNPYLQGYRKQGIGVTDEPTGEGPSGFGTDTGTVLIDGGKFLNINWSAVKTKVAGNVKLKNFTIDSCAQEVENGTSLIGSLCLNANGKILVDGITILNSGDAGINLLKTGDYPYTSPFGASRSQYLVANTFIDGTGLTTPSLGYAIIAQTEMGDISLITNKMRNVLGSRAIYFLGSPTRRMNIAEARGNLIYECPAASVGIGAEYVRKLMLDANDISGFKAGGSGVLATNGIDMITVGSADRVRDPFGIVDYGYNIAARVVKFHGAAVNTVYPAWAAAAPYVTTDRVYNGNYVYQCEAAGTSAASGGPVATTMGSVELDGGVAVGAAGSPAPAGATITASPTVATPALVGVYTVICTVGGSGMTSQWAVRDLAGNLIGTALGNTLFSAGGVSFTITDAGTDPVVGEKFTITVTGVNWVCVGYKRGLQYGLRITGTVDDGIVDGALFSDMAVAPIFSPLPSNVLLGNIRGLTPPAYTNIGSFTDWTAFTPSIEGSTTPGTHAYATRTAGYCRIGPLIFIDIEVTATMGTAGNAAAGNLRITGLPVAARNVTEDAHLTLEWGGLTFPAGYVNAIGTIVGGTSYIEIRRNGSAQSASIVALSEVGSQLTLKLSGCYFA